MCLYLPAAAAAVSLCILLWNTMCFSSGVFSLWCARFICARDIAYGFDFDRQLVVGLRH